MYCIYDHAAKAHCTNAKNILHYQKVTKQVSTSKQMTYLRFAVMKCSLRLQCFDTSVLNNNCNTSLM